MPRTVQQWEETAARLFVQFAPQVVTMSYVRPATGEYDHDADSYAWTEAEGGTAPDPARIQQETGGIFQLETGGDLLLEEQPPVAAPTPPTVRAIISGSEISQADGPMKIHKCIFLAEEFRAQGINELSDDDTFMWGTTRLTIMDIMGKPESPVPVIYKIKLMARAK